MQESTQAALYFLFGEAEEDADARVYIGQTGDLTNRLNSHNRDRDLWQRALVLISRTNSLTQTHSLFLEWYSIQSANKAGRYVIENGNAGSKPYTPAPLESDCWEIFETGKILVATLGYPIFDAVPKSVGSSEAQEVFYCRASDSDAQGLYTPEGFVVLKGSVGRKADAPSIPPWLESFRSKLLQSGVIHEDGGKIIFTTDHLFKTPGGAASALTGRTTHQGNWKTQDGKSLVDVIHQQSEEKP